MRLVQQLGHLAGALNITVAGTEGANGIYNKLNSAFSGCIETVKVGVENEASEAESSLGGYLELYSRCLDQENAMLLRRTTLMLEWEAACKAVEKARPNREEAAKTVRFVQFFKCVQRCSMFNYILYFTHLIVKKGNKNQVKSLQLKIKPFNPQAKNSKLK